MVGELREKEQHHDKYCEYVDEEHANKCGWLVIRKDMEKHKEKLCPRRKTRCEHCSSTVEWKELQDHYKKCPNYPVMCNNCGERVARYKMADHVDHQGTCPNSLLHCKLSDIGCLFIGN